MSMPCPKSATATVAPFRMTVRLPSRRQQVSNAGSGRKTPADPAIRHWLASFHQIHTEDDTYTPVALRLAADGHETGDRADSAQGSAAQLAVGRRVYEVALRRDALGERWVLIAWEVDVPGIQFCDCAGRDEAMALFSEPTKAAGRWHGVRLSAESRPW